MVLANGVFGDCSFNCPGVHHQKRPVMVIRRIAKIPREECLFRMIKKTLSENVRFFLLAHVPFMII